ncbi:MAG: HmuY family protein, partial [Daejeonella sp.]
MNKLFNSFYIIVLLTIFSSCRKDTPLPDNLIQFETEKTGFEAIQNEVDIKLNLSRVAEANTSVTVELISTGIIYGNQFTTEPASTNNLLTVIIPAGSSSNSFKVKKKAGVLLHGDESLKFAIKTITQPVMIGKKNNLELSFSPIVSTGTDLMLNGGTGGAAAVNSVFVDLSASTSKSVARASWDLGFYNGADFRVIINNTNGAAAIKIDKTDLKQVTAADVNPASLAIGAGSGTLDLMDHPDGDLSKTVIKEITANEADNKVYVISRIGGTPSVNDLMKIRILRNANGYTLQYAKLDDTNFTTITINKNAAYNFIAFSFDHGVADVEPVKE